VWKIFCERLFERANVTFKVLDNNLIVITPSEIGAFQQVRITGTVTDSETGEPLPGVNIIVDGTTVGVVTDIDGLYSIEVPSADRDTGFSFVGYSSQRVPIAGKGD
jgi:hypothetical protein